MKQLYYTAVDREGFLRSLSGVSTEAREILDIDQLQLPSFYQRNEITLLWKRQPQAGEPPRIVVVEEHARREFFAFASTYISTFAPLSAFIRVVSPEEMISVAVLLARDDVTGVGVLKGLASVAIAEAFIQLGITGGGVDQVSVQACHGTFSMAVLRSIVLGFGSKGIVAVGRNWQACRALLADDPLPLPAREVEAFWAVIGDALTPNYLGRSSRISHRLVDIASSLLGGRRDMTEVWRSLTQDLPELRHAADKMNGSREDRVRILDGVVQILRHSRSVDPQVRGAILGYLLSRISNGSLGYLDLSRNIAPELPMTSLWYALFSSSEENTDALSIGGSLGRRILRDVSANCDILEPPTADISLSELAVLTSDHPRALGFRSNFSSTIDVELYPGVNGRYRARRQATEPNKTGLTKAQLDEMKALLYRLNDLVRDVDREVRSKPVSPIDDGPLFGAKRRTKK